MTELRLPGIRGSNDVAALTTPDFRTLTLARVFTVVSNSTLVLLVESGSVAEDVAEALLEIWTPSGRVLALTLPRNRRFLDVFAAMVPSEMFAPRVYAAKFATLAQFVASGSQDCKVLGSICVG